MKQLVMVIASSMGMLSVVFGAFGAHALKKVLSLEKISSFEVGVRYQMYHAILLLFMGLALNFQNSLERRAAWFIMAGVLLFSGSIYVLSFSEQLRGNMKWIGAITPLGGLLLIIGWALLSVSLYKAYA